MYNDNHGWCILPRAIIATVLVSTPSASLAQSEYPSRAIKIVVPLQAGSIPDTVPRILAERLAARWRQPVIIENRPGAAHSIGAEAVARSEPDGYTLLATPGDTLVVNQHLYSGLRYDPAAFVPVSVLVRVPTVLVVNPKGPFLTLQDLLAFAHANPGRITYASPGAGTFPHLLTEMLRATAGVRLAHVPYKGMVLAMSDLLAGRVDMAIDAVGNSLSNIRDGKLKALAIASEARIPQLPDIPTISEMYPGFLSTSGWIAVVATPRTPPAVAAELSQAIVETLALPQVAKRLYDLSVTPVGISPIEAAILVKQERERWRKIVETIGVKLD